MTLHTDGAMEAGPALLFRCVRGFGSVNESRRQRSANVCDAIHLAPGNISVVAESTWFSIKTGSPHCQTSCLLRWICGQTRRQTSIMGGSMRQSAANTHNAAPVEPQLHENQLRVEARTRVLN